MVYIYIRTGLYVLGLCRGKTHLHTWESVQKIVPVPAVPEPNSPEGVVPEYPSWGDFLAGSNLYFFGINPAGLGIYPFGRAINLLFLQ